jgi:hypothetical protein
VFAIIAVHRDIAGSFGDLPDLQRLLLTEEAQAIKANETPAGTERLIAFLSSWPLLLFSSGRLPVSHEHDRDDLKEE